MAASRRPPTDSGSTSVNKPRRAVAAGTPPAAIASGADGASPTAAPSKAAPRGAKARKGGPASTQRATVTPEQRHAMIAEGAYLRAERRGFIGGDTTGDWLAAEREVDELLGASVSNSAQ